MSDVLTRLAAVIEARKGADPSGSWTASTWRADVRDDFGGTSDGFSFFGGLTGTGHGDYVPAVGGIQDSTSDTSIFSSDDISELFSLNAADWPSITGSIRFDEDTVGSGVWETVSFDVTSVEPVPEPGTFALIAIGVFGIAMARRRRRVPS